MNIKEAKEYCMSYSTIEIDGRYYYTQEQVINMIENILGG